MPVATLGHGCGLVNTTGGLKVVVTGGLTDNYVAGPTQVYDVQSQSWIDTGIVVSSVSVECSQAFFNIFWWT